MWTQFIADSSSFLSFYTFRTQFEFELREEISVPYDSFFFLKWDDSGVDVNKKFKNKTKTKKKNPRLFTLYISL